MTYKGGGLGRFPPGKQEQAHRKERLEQIRLARRTAERIVDENGRKWKLVRLPDAPAYDYPVEDV
jgi:hypothetical protein